VILLDGIAKAEVEISVGAATEYRGVEARAGGGVAVGGTVAVRRLGPLRVLAH
jgi:hypothetical protein